MGVPAKDIYVMLTRCQPDAIAEADAVCKKFESVNFVSFLPETQFQDLSGTKAGDNKPTNVMKGSATGAPWEINQQRRAPAPRGKQPAERIYESLSLTQHANSCKKLVRVRADARSVFPALNSEFWNDQLNGFFHELRDAGPEAERLQETKNNLWDQIHVRLHIYYMWALGFLYLFYDYVAVLEDDLILSPSGKFFRGVIPVMEEDYSLISASAWNDNALEVTRNIDVKKDYRPPEGVFGAFPSSFAEKSAEDDVNEKKPKRVVTPLPPGAHVNVPQSEHNAALDPSSMLRLSTTAAPTTASFRRDALYVLRENHFGGLGWMTSRRVFEYVLLPFMTVDRLTMGWDSILSFLVDKLIVNSKTGYPFVAGTSGSSYGVALRNTLQWTAAEKNVVASAVLNGDTRFFTDEMCDLWEYHPRLAGTPLIENAIASHKDLLTEIMFKRLLAETSKKDMTSVAPASLRFAETLIELKHKGVPLESSPMFAGRAARAAPKDEKKAAPPEQDHNARRIDLLKQSVYAMSAGGGSWDRVGSLYPSVGLTHHRTTKTGISVKTAQNAKDLDKLQLWTPQLNTGVGRQGAEEHLKDFSSGFLAWNYEPYLAKLIGLE
eukprot:g1241.t1